MERKYGSKPTLNVSINLNCVLESQAFKANLVDSNAHISDLSLGNGHVVSTVLEGPAPSPRPAHTKVFLDLSLSEGQHRIIQWLRTAKY